MQQQASQWSWIMPFLTGAFGVLSTLVVNHFYTKAKAKREGREKLFRTLMVTRGYRLARESVEALCAVEVEFHGDNEKDRNVRKAWKHYRDHLDVPVPPQDDKASNDEFNREREDRFVGLLYEVGKAIGKEYSRTELEKAYLPGLWWEIEVENQLLRKGLLKVLDAKGAVPVAVVYDQLVEKQIARVTQDIEAKAVEQGGQR